MLNIKSINSQPFLDSSTNYFHSTLLLSLVTPLEIGIITFLCLLPKEGDIKNTTSIHLQFVYFINHLQILRFLQSLQDFLLFENIEIGFLAK